MITTIQLNDKVKETLATYKNSPRESYEEVILNLISKVEQKDRSNKELLKESCFEMEKENKKISKEFKHIDKEMDSIWEW